MELRPRDVVLSVRKDDAGRYHMTLTHKPTGTTVHQIGDDYEKLRTELEEMLALSVDLGPGSAKAS
jgi:hypothetical protein